MSLRSRLLLTFVTIATLSSVALAQPRISYLIPDLGTTRFATYIEVVGPHTAFGDFGADGFYLNNPGDDVRVRVQRPADTLIVKIGPCVVSWNGRLISTHIFVDPEVNPNSDKWDELNSRFRIPIVVEVGGRESLADTFYIVRPFTFGDRRADANRVLGEASLGRRSKRGAMIVDSMILAANASYTVSKLNSDPLAMGNQGYLPFVLLSVGNVVGSGGSQIEANASGADGGPGGGGGGGGYANFAFGSSERGFNGGNGYTGGGPGGYNNSGIPLAPSNSKRKPGTGSGQDLLVSNSNVVGSAALNGQPGGNSTSSFENAGGGTGHPFGGSGDACADRNNCDVVGGHGGGSGAREGERGGAGGFGTAGQNENGRTNGGKIHGNESLIPLAGGSGSASGNPDGTNVSSSGGGGGGAVSLHGQMVANLDIFARGASAESRDIRAGSGSGGGVIIGSRVDNSGVGPFGAQVNTRTSNGFLEGGRGRPRYDARVPDAASYYVGPLTDTLTASLRDVELTGHGDGSDLYIYVKPENGDWLVLDTVAGYLNSWRTTVRLPGSDTVYYVCVGQNIGLPQRETYVYDPEVVLSQSAWNIIRLFGPPIIQAPTDADMGVYSCRGTRVYDTITVTNLGESPLEIATATWAGSAGFSMVSPTSFPDTIITNSSKEYIISYLSPPGMTGPQIGQLVLKNNDTIPGSDPWIINFTIDVRLVELEYVWRGIRGDSIDIGELCVNSPLIDQITVTNIGPDPVELINYLSADPTLLLVGANLPFTIEPTLSRNLFMEISARRLGPAIVPTLLFVNDCPLPDTLWVKFTGVSPKPTLVGNGQFGVVPVGSTRQLILEIRNDGTSDLDFQSLPAVAAPFTLISAVPAPPTILAPGESMILTYEFAPTAAGQFTETFIVESIAWDASCADTIDIVLAGIGANIGLTASPNFLQFGTIGTCEEDTLVVDLTNTGTAPVTLLYPGFINGANAADFQVLRQPAQDTTLQPGQVAMYTIVFNPSVGPVVSRNAVLSIRTNQGLLPEVEIGLAGSRAVADITGPRVVDLGLIPVGVPTVVRRTYTNNAPSEVTVDRLSSSNVAELGATPAPFTMLPTGTQEIDFTVTPLSEQSNEDTIWVATDLPCPDSFAVIVRWTSEAPEIGVQNFVEFGTLSNCEFVLDTLMIANTGSIPIDLIDVKVIGTDAALFTILNPQVATNVTIDPLDTVVLNIEFDPRASTDGLKSAQVETRARINDQPTSLLTELSGTRRTSIPSTPNNVAFGQVDVLSTSEQMATIVNIGSDPIRITEVVLAGAPSAVYAIVPLPLPTTLQPNERLDVRLRFTPIDNVRYVDSVIVRFDQPCADELPIPVTGNGRLNIEVELLMPQVFIDPADDNVVLDVRAAIATGSTVDLTSSLRMVMMFDSPLFVARGVSNGTIVRNEVVAGRTEVEIDIPALILSPDTTTIFQVFGQGTIGPLDSTDVVAFGAEMNVEGTQPGIRNRDGWIILGVCEEGGKRLIQRSGSFSIEPRPTPASTHLDVAVSVYERGLHTVQVVDAQGSIVYTETWSHVPGASVRMLHLDAASMPAGAYQIRVLTPTRERTVPALIVH